MGSIINVTPKSYVEYESVENWAGEFAEYIMDKHKNSPVLDHPDGCVTENKLSDDLREKLSETVETANEASEIAGTAKGTAEVARTVSETAKVNSEEALAMALTSSADAGQAVAKAEAAFVKAEDANAIAEDAKRVSVECDTRTKKVEKELEYKAEKTEMPQKVSQLENDAEYITQSILTDTTYSLYEFISKDTNDLWERKADKVKISTSKNASYTFDFSDMYNSEMRLASPSAVSIVFKDDEYSPDYISGLSFNSGETPTGFDYTDSGIINWIGTDCTTFSYQISLEGDIATISLFIPSPNTHYDIVFYYNGNQFIGLVNGFVPATGNVVSE